MYHLLRRLHLFTGLLILVFVMMYFLTGYIMIHGKWFGPRVSKESTKTWNVDFPEGLKDAEAVRYLQSELRLRGQSGTPEHRKDGSIRINFVRPGTTFLAVIEPGHKQVTVTRKEFGFNGLANGLHRLRGYGGGWAYWVWSLMYDLASGALIVFGVTGILLWYQSTVRHLGGWLCLATSFGLTAAMILYLTLSR